MDQINTSLMKLFAEERDNLISAFSDSEHILKQKKKVKNILDMLQKYKKMFESLYGEYQNLANEPYKDSLMAITEKERITQVSGLSIRTGPSLFMHYNDGVKINISPRLSVKIKSLPKSVFQGKNNTIKCKFGSRNKCPNKKCLFVHTGQKFIRHLTFPRSPNNPNLGELETLHEDLCKATFKDIKMLLFYAVPDLILANAWCELHNITHDIVIEDLDGC